MAAGREIHGEVVLDVELSGEERAKARLQESFAKLEASVNVNADFNRAQVQTALDRVANRGSGISVNVKAKFSLAQMRTAAKTAADKGNGISVSVNAKFSRAQIQRELIASSAGLKIPVVTQIISGGDGKGITSKLQAEYRLLAQASAASDAAAKDAVRGVNQRLSSFQASSARMRQISAEAEIARVQDVRRANIAIEAEQRKAEAAMNSRLDKQVDERRRDAQQITKTTHSANEAIRVDEEKTANLRKRLEAEVNAVRDKGADSQRVFAEKEQEKRVTAELNNESRAEHGKDVIRARGNEARLSQNNATLGRIEVREDSHAKRLVELEQASALRREVIEAQLQARLAAADRSFEQRRQLAAERADAATRAHTNKPIVQRILVDADKLNASLTDFDRAVTRVLKTTLLSFTVWSGAVVAVVGAVGVAAEATFAKFELAATRAAGVSASSAINEQVAKTGKAVHSFAVQLDSDRKLIESRAIQVSLQTIGFDPTEISTGIQNLLQSGQSLPEALHNIGIAAKFAQINGDTLDETTTNLAAAMAAAGLKSKDTAKFLDEVQLSSQNALGGAGDFLTALANGASAAARAFGDTNKDALVLIQLLANTGITGREAGTQGSIVFREFNKVIGQSGKQLKEANVDTTTFGSSVTGIAKAFDDAKKSGKNVFAFGKDLGFTQKSIRSIINILPQLQDLGPGGFANLAKQAENATGVVQQQAQAQRKTIAAQFDNLGDTVKALAIRFGEAASGPVRDFFDTFAGEGGLLDQASKRVTAFGARFGDAVAGLVEFINTQAFRNGIDTLVESVEVTLGGVRDSFSAFTGAFAKDGETTRSTFEAIADSVLAFATLSARVLPRVAELIGRIFNFAIEHADAFEAFAKFALALFAIRKAYALLLKPALTATAAIQEYTKAVVVAGATGEGTAIASGLATVAGKFGLIQKNAAAAQLAVDGLTAAESRNAFAQTGVGFAGAAGDASRASRVQTSGRGVGALDAAAGTGELGSAFALRGKATEASKSTKAFAAALDVANPKTGKFAIALEKVSALIVGLTPAFVEATPLIGGVAAAFADLAVPFAIVAAIAIGIAGFFTGIVKGFTSTIHTSDATAKGFHRLGTALKAVADATFFVIKIIFKLGEALGSIIGKGLAYAIGGTVNAIAAVGDAVGKAGGAIKGLFSSEDEVATHTDFLASSLDKIREAQYQASFSANQMAQANHTVAVTSDLMAQAQQQAADQIAGSIVFAQGKTESFIHSIGGFEPAFNNAAVSGVNAMTQIANTAQTTEASLLAVQAAIQASLGQSANATQSLIDSELNNPNVVIPGVSKRAAIAANTEQKRQAALIKAARKAQRDAQIVGEALGTGTKPGDKAATGAAPAPKLAKFTDPDAAIQLAIDRLKPAKKIAETNALITKVTTNAGKSYQLTRRDTLLLAEAMPVLDKAIDKQKKKVDDLTSSIDALKNVQLAGTQAFTDAAFANDQAQKKLQLARIDALAVPGTTEDSQSIKDIDAQLKALQTSAERASLVESLQLDPLKKKLTETFDPIKELSFDDIVAQFTKLSASRDTETAKLTQQEAVQTRLNNAVDASKSKYDKLDAAAQASVEALNASRTAAASTASAVNSVATSADAGASSVNKFSGAVKDVPAGKDVVDKSLKGINARVAELVPQFTGAGARVVNAYAAGMAQSGRTTLLTTLTTIVNAIGPYLNVPGGTGGIAYRAGQSIMGGFLGGLKEGFGTPAVEGSVAWYLNVFIPKWIRENKGPVSYDATILVPAGHAVMEGFGKGLRSGFAQIQSFVKDVGPSLSEYVSTDLFSDRTASIMADISLGKKPDIDAALADLRPADLNLAGFSGPVDASLGFLHKTLSLKDTTLMAQQLAKLFGLQVTALRDDHSYLTASGNVSDHALGLAADLSNSSGGGDDPRSNTPQMLALAKALEPLQGKVIKQLIYQNRDRATGAAIGGHQNHDHIAFLAGKGFSADSGKIGKPSVVDIPGASDRVDAAISAASQKYGVELALLAAVAKQESGFNPNALSPAGASGLFQFIPSTAKGFGINPLIPEEAAAGGARYLRNLLEMFSGRYDYALAGYNAGPGAVKKYGGVPPYAETQNYVRQITQYLEMFRKQFGGYREMGGPVSPNKAYVVGEKRPEIFVPRTAGTILPDANATLSGGSGRTYQDNRTIHNVVHTNATDAHAIADVLDARTRSRMTGVNFR